jgi:hypothetical protein
LPLHPGVAPNSLKTSPAKETGDGLGDGLGERLGLGDGLELGDTDGLGAGDILVFGIVITGSCWGAVLGEGTDAAAGGGATGGVVLEVILGVTLGLGVGDVLGLGLAIATFWGLGFAAVTLISGGGVGGRGIANMTPCTPMERATKSDRIGRGDFKD